MSCSVTHVDSFGAGNWAVSEMAEFMRGHILWHEAMLAKQSGLRLDGQCVAAHPRMQLRVRSPNVMCPFGTPSCSPRRALPLSMSGMVLF